MLDQDKELIKCHSSKVEFLEKIIESGKIPHAFLFTGPKGIGKSNIAYLFAEMLLSIGKPEIEEKNTSEEVDLFGEIGPKKDKKPSKLNPVVSEKIKKGIHLDLLIMKKNEEDDKKNISVEEVRHLGKYLSLTPAESQYRVAIIDSIDDFNNSSANAILKNLEEPTKNTVLIIICHSKANLLPTIKSRCHEVNFKPLSKKDFIIILSDAGHENEKLEDIYDLSEGSPGLALEIIRKKVNESLDKYLNILDKKIVNITDITSLAKELKDKGSWDIFGKLLLKKYSKKIKQFDKPTLINQLNNYSELNKIISLSSHRNMDIQDSLKLITYQLNNI